MAFFLIGLLGLAIGATVGALFSSGASAENIATESVQALVNVSNNASQGCVVSADQVISVNISGNTGGTLNLNENFRQFLILNSSCLQSVTFQNNISQIMSQEADQIAKAISQQFELSSAKAKNVVNETANLAIQVSNSFVQNCAGFESQIAVFNLTNNTNLNANVYQNWEQYNASQFQCVMQDQAVNTTMQQVQQTVNQEAEATVQNFFAVLFGMIFAIFAAIGIIIFGLIFFGFFERSSTPAAPPQQIITNAGPPVDPEIAAIIAQENPTIPGA